MPNIERIDALIEVLRDPKAHVPDLILFDMQEFGVTATLLDYEWAGDDIDFQSFTDDYHECGTVCCAIGLAGLAQKTRALGIHFDLELNVFTVGGDGVDNGHNAAQQWLDIAPEQAIWIFSDMPLFYHMNGFRDTSDGTLRPEDVIKALEALKNPSFEWKDILGRPLFQS